MEKPPAPARKRPLWGRLGPVLGRDSAASPPVGREPQSLPFLAALAEGEGDAKLTSSGKT